MNLWPHQSRALHDLGAAIGRDGHRRICLACPTGGGKTRIMLEFALRFLQEGLSVALYTNRKMLLEQLSKTCLDEGIYHGIRAAGYPDEREHRFQLCSIQTEHSRCIRSKRRNLHDARLVLVDEAHLHTSDMAGGILGRHYEDGARIVGFTATPIDLGNTYDHLIQAGVTSELVKCGALVPAMHYAPDEPDTETIKGIREGEDLSEGQQVKALMGNETAKTGLFGRIWENFERINPERGATICFAPDVRGSIWIAEQFCKRGIRAAHIDGERIWLDGELYPSTRELRQKVLDESREGKIVVLCNRFVLREGIDCPWLVHCIFACIFGSLQSYLQSGGRLLRAFPGILAVTVQDHGGNYWRHGSLNEDRVWSLDDTGPRLYAERAERMRNAPEKQPFTCPRCKRVWVSGKFCSPARGGCGFELPEFGKRSRAVVTSDGRLKLVSGPPIKQRRPYTAPDGPKKWEQMYWRARSDKWNASWGQAAAMFAHENFGQWPERDWPLMPINKDDWYIKVSQVKTENLVPRPK